ncbi:uncharacterized protein LOC135700437 [Ochlerotatus camptorhynchus]|uniref:uncharacterized protein LOC135700437 n=1 Tax=Ochlerotatus camptorhynchus TaxID=644619 RepID=UPI0031CF67BA
MARKRQTTAQKRVLEMAKARNEEVLQEELGEPSVSTCKQIQFFYNPTSAFYYSAPQKSIRKPSKLCHSALQQSSLMRHFSPTKVSKSIHARRPQMALAVAFCGGRENQGISEDATEAIGLTDKQVCACELQAKVYELEAQVIDMQAELEQAKEKMSKLKKKKHSLKISHAKLQQALVSKVLPTSVKPFRDEGFPSSEIILRMSMEEENSDYLFVKFLMTPIWPVGFKGRRTSNNPTGRPKSKSKAT